MISGYLSPLDSEGNIARFADLQDFFTWIYDDKMECHTTPCLTMLVRSLKGFDDIVSLVEKFGTYHTKQWTSDGKSLMEVTLHSLCKQQTYDDSLEDFLKCVGDTAFLVSAGVKDKLPPKTKMDLVNTPTFSPAELSELSLMKNEIQRRVEKHKHDYKKLQQAQKKLWKLQKESKPSNDSVLQRLTKLYNGARKSDTRRDKGNKSLNFAQCNFQERIALERRSRDEVFEMSKTTKDVITEKIKSRIEVSITNMYMALSHSRCFSYWKDTVYRKLRLLEPSEIAISIFKSVSRFYSHTNIEEFLSYTKNTEKIPDFELMSETDFESEKRTEFKNVQKLRRVDSENVSKGLLTDQADEELPIEKQDIQKLRYMDFLQNKCKLMVKEKLSLMDGKVGFGWTRKRKFATKRYTFLVYSDFCC